MPANGFVKVYRQMREWEWYKDSVTKDVFLELLLTANFKESRFMGIEIPRGSVVCSQTGLADSLGFTTKQIRRAMDNLKKSGEVAVTRHSKYSVVVLKNYDKYQDEGQSEGRSQVQSEGRSQGSERAISEERKNSRNKESNNPPSSLPPPTKAECVAFFEERGKSEKIGMAFYEKWYGLNWTLNGEKIKNWKAFAEKDMNLRKPEPKNSTNDDASYDLAAAEQNALTGELVPRNKRKKVNND